MSLANGSPGYINVEQFKKIVAEIDGEVNKIFCRLLWETGLRVSEALAIVGGDVLVAEGWVRIHRLKARGDVSRVLPLPRKLLAAMAGLVQPADLSARLFKFSRQWAYEMVAEAAIRAGVHVQDGERARTVHPHTFRHSLAVRWMKAGGDAPRLQRWLGHKSFETTMVYLQFSPGDLGCERTRIFGV